MLCKESCPHRSCKYNRYTFFDSGSARQGTAQSIRSDNETNFVGTSNKLKKALDGMNQEQIRQHLEKSRTGWVNWQKNPPEASHTGGIWKRQIRPAQTILEALLKHMVQV